MCWLIKWRSEQISAARWKSVKFARLHFLFVNWDWISQGLAQYDCMCRYYKANTKYQRISTCRMMLLEPCRISVLRRYFTKESSVPSRVSAYWKSRYVGGKTTFRTPGCTGWKKIVSTEKCQSRNLVRCFKLGIFCACFQACQNLLAKAVFAWLRL